MYQGVGADPGILQGGDPAEFSSKRGGPTTYPGAICIANKQNLLNRGGGGALDTRVPIRKKHLLHSSAVRCGKIFHSPSACASPLYSGSMGPAK